MIYHIDDLRTGFDIDADAVVVGSGAGGAVAALNLGMAGMRVVVLEAGPQVTPREMTRDVPSFMAKYFWEGGLRMMEGTSFHPAMQGRMLGGSTVSNSAIMFELPRWIRQEWNKSHGPDFLESRHMQEAYKRVFKRTSTIATPKAAMGYRNLARHVLS